MKNSQRQHSICCEALERPRTMQSAQKINFEVQPLDSSDFMQTDLLSLQGAEP